MATGQNYIADLAHPAGHARWLQHARQAWRVLTSGGDHAEAYLERAVDIAKAKSDAAFDSLLESLRCDVDSYITAEEKLAMEIVTRFPEWMQRELSVVRERRRREGLSALIGRQLLAWGIRKFCRDEVRDRNTARSAMASLQDALSKAAPATHQFRRLIQAIESNLGLESAEDMSDDEVLDILENLLEMILDFKSQMELHREVAMPQRSYQALIHRLKHMVDRDEEKLLRKQQEEALTKQLGTTVKALSGKDVPEKPGNKSGAGHGRLGCRY